MSEGLNELRVKVAELFGWHDMKQFGARGDWFGYPKERERRGPHDRVPDFCNDLNACAEFRKAMTFSQRQRFFNLLKSITAPTKRYELADSELIWATSEQRCRAFVATMEGK